jgi:hypothetical protein
MEFHDGYVNQTVTVEQPIHSATLQRNKAPVSCDDNFFKDFTELFARFFVVVFRGQNTMHLTAHCESIINTIKTIVYVSKTSRKNETNGIDKSQSTVSI